MIVEMLSSGEEKARTTAELCAALKCDTRELRKIVAYERRKGQLILSSNHGYFTPKDTQEVREYLNLQDKKVRSAMCALRSARNYLKQTENQISFKI